MTENTENAPCVVKKKCCMRLCEDSLIEKVKLHPHLYDINSIDYKDSKRCVNTWLVIANELGLPGEWKVCKERWRTLRDVYVRNKRCMSGQQGGSGGGEACTKRPKWKFFDQMDFLAPHVNHRPWRSEAETLVPSLDSGSPRSEMADVDAMLCDDSNGDCFEDLKQEEEDEEGEQPRHHSTQDTDSEPQPITMVDGRPIKEEVEWVDEEMEPVIRSPLSPFGEPASSPPPAVMHLKLDTNNKRVLQPDDRPPPLKLRLNILNSATGEAMLGNKRIRLMLPGTVSHMPGSHTPVQIRTKTVGCEASPRLRKITINTNTANTISTIHSNTTNTNTSTTSKGSTSTTTTNVIHISSNNTETTNNKTSNVSTSKIHNPSANNNTTTVYKSIIRKTEEQQQQQHQQPSQQHQQPSQQNQQVVNRMPVTLPKREVPVAAKERMRTPKKTPPPPFQPTSMTDTVAQDEGRQNRGGSAVRVPASSVSVDDEDELYGRYITAALRKLSYRSRCLAKVKIQQVLFYLQEADRGNDEYEHKLRCTLDEGVFE